MFHGVGSIRNERKPYDGQRGPVPIEPSRPVCFLKISRRLSTFSADEKNRAKIGRPETGLPIRLVRVTLFDWRLTNIDLLSYDFRETNRFLRESHAFGYHDTVVWKQSSIPSALRKYKKAFALLRRRIHTCWGSKKKRVVVYSTNLPYLAFQSLNYLSIVTDQFVFSYIPYYLR